VSIEQVRRFGVKLDTFTMSAQCRLSGSGRIAALRRTLFRVNNATRGNASAALAIREDPPCASPQDGVRTFQGF
jgi:hypothetical protein